MCSQSAIEQNIYVSTFAHFSLWKRLFEQSLEFPVLYNFAHSAIFSI